MNDNNVIHIASNLTVQGKKHFTVARKFDMYEIYSYRIAMKKPIFKKEDPNDIVDDCFIQRTGEETFQKICQDLNIQWTNKAIKTYTIFYNFNQEDHEKLYFYIKIIGEQIA